MTGMFESMPRQHKIHMQLLEVEARNVSTLVPSKQTLIPNRHRTWYARSVIRCGMQIYLSRRDEQDIESRLKKLVNDVSQEDDAG